MQTTLTSSAGIKEYAGVDVVVGPTCHEPGCRGYGSLDSSVVFVGIAPGRDEVVSGRPLTGPSGRVLDHTLKALGQDRKQVYCTNLICWYKDDPSEGEAKRCSGRLDEELKACQPKLIVLLGKIVAEIYTGRPFAKVRGSVQWNEEYNCYVMVTYHPAAILHSIGEYGSSKDDKATAIVHDFVRDLKKIPQILQWKEGAPEAQVEYTVVDNPILAQKVLDSLPRDDIVALDVETRYEKDDDEEKGLRDDLLCVGVGTSEHAWVLTPEAYFIGDKPALEWPTDVLWVMQNSIFDMQIMKNKLDVWISVKEDTMLQSYSLEERSGIHGLKPLSREYLAAPFYEEKKGDKKVHELEKSVLYEYNARDVVYTARLCKKFKVWQEEDNVRGFYERLLIPAVNMYKELQYRGCKINKKLHYQFAVMWGERMIKEEDELVAWAKDEGYDGDINLNAPEQLSRFLFVILGLPIIKYTKKGRISVDIKVLEALKSQHPFIDRLIEFRHLSKMVSTYIFGLMNQVDENYMAHAIVKLHGSRTGRPSYVKPPLQTIPVPYAYKDDFGLLRRLFITTDVENNLIIEADYGKAEIWMAYNESGDQQMYADLISGDYHTTVAVDVLEKERKDVTGKDRLDMKRVTFGVMYDREAKSLSEVIKSSAQTAQNYINRFFERNKGYAIWFKETQQNILKEGELVTKTGRKRRVIILSNEVRLSKQAVNFPIQSVASDVLLDSAIEIHPRIKEVGGHLLFTVHDAIIAEALKARLQESLKIIHDSMIAHRFDSVCSIPVELKVGTSWGDTVEVHDCAKTEEQNDKNMYGVRLGGRCLW